MNKEICLGTAMWGWSVNENVAFNILDRFYDFGGRYIDTAYNYPINGDESKILYSAKLVSRWKKKLGVDDLNIMFKIGSVSNKKTNEIDLSDDNLSKMSILASELFENSLYSLMIHWDNRDGISEIYDTLAYLSGVCEHNRIRLGLSGIKHIEIYSKLINKLSFKQIDQQVKNSFIPDHVENLTKMEKVDFRLWAYGICGSGLKMSTDEYRRDSYVKLVRMGDYHNNAFPDDLRKNIEDYISQSNIVDNLYQYSMLQKELDEKYFGYLVSPSRICQLEQIISFKKKYDSFVFSKES